MAIKTQHVRVSGRVQGVAFRHYTKLQADRIGISGWVRNCHDGSVESIISGSSRQMEDMVAWLHRGSPSAAVTEVHVTEIENPEPFTSFDIRY